MTSLTLIRGHSGSGKSTLAREKADLCIKAIVIEADQYFINEQGKYNYNHGEIKQAHAWCQDEVRHYLSAGYDVFVANTACRLWEVKVYQDIAEDFDTKLNVIECTGNFANTHDVSIEVVEQQKSRFESMERE
jgi:predicted kinase